MSQRIFVVQYAGNAVTADSDKYQLPSLTLGVAIHRKIVSPRLITKNFKFRDIRISCAFRYPAHYVMSDVTTTLKVTDATRIEMGFGQLCIPIALRDIRRAISNLSRF